MKTIIVSILMLLCVIFQNCGDEAYNWLNIKYVECLEDRLPCECEKLVGTYYSIAIDTSFNSKNYGITLSKFSQMEPYIYPLKRININEFMVLKSKDDNTGFGKLIFDNNTLFFIEDSIVSEFSKSEIVNAYNRSHYLKDNVQLLNKSFTERGYPNLESIVEKDSLLCDCNKWMGGVDLLFVKGSSQAWVLDIESDSLRIKTITNSAESDPGDPIITEIFKAYKW